MSARNASSSPARARASVGSVTAVIVAVACMCVMTTGPAGKSSTDFASRPRLDGHGTHHHHHQRIARRRRRGPGRQGGHRARRLVHRVRPRRPRGLDRARDGRVDAGLRPLLGRRSDAWFAERWLPRTGAWPDRLNGLPKYVVSSTLDEPRWSNATVLRGIEDVAAAKLQVDGEILVFASYELIRGLLSQGLADELRLIVFPVVLGGGKRLFGEPADGLRLVETRAVGTGLAFLRYLTR